MTASVFAARRERLAAQLADREIDAALVTRLVNVRYLTGLASSNAAALITANGSAVLATDGRYATAAREQAPEIDLVVDRQVASVLARRAVDSGMRALGIEEHEVTLEQHERLREVAKGLDLVHLARAIEGLRQIKDDTEIDAVREACAISSHALEELLEGAFVGRTEKEIARDLENRMYAHGADGIAFETIVATGANSALPHHRPTSREVRRGDFLKIDFGAQVRGYHADCTRTVVVAEPPSAWQREIYELVAAAQRTGIAAATPGEACIDVDRVARDVIQRADYGEQFSHGLGHGVGLEVHEAPMLGYNAPGTLADRMLVTVEPGIYLPGQGGVRIEDTLVVRDASAGGPQPLTTTTKELLVVGA